MIIVGSIVLVLEDYLFVKALSHICLKFLKTILIVSLVRPVTNLRRSRSFADLPNEDLYTRIPPIPFRPEENIEPLELRNFAEDFQLHIPDDLNLFINRQIDIVREIEPDLAGQIEPDLNRQNEAELVIEPPDIILDNNPAGIEILYDDVENVNMNMLRFQNLRAPRFDAKQSNVRTFFRKF